MKTFVRRGLAASASIAAVVALAVATPTSAAPTDTSQRAAEEASSGATLTGKQLSRKVLALHRKGKTAVQIDRALEPYGFSISRPAAYDAEQRTVAARSGGGDMTVSAPFIVHDEGSRWYWMANYRWNNSDFSNDQTYSCRFYDRCKLPGKDAYGLYFDRRQDIRGYWASFGHKSTSLPDARLLSPWERNRFGVVFKKQDIVYRPSSPDDLNMYYGNITVQVHGRPCGSSTAWTKYAHTWGNKGIPSVSINAGFMSFSFSGDGKKWQKISQPGANRRRC
ncbi:hypothetical protein [Nocardioides donggukensis]|uniref:Tat pathway signal sequence domain protein n=1 Tax=Nocardioides donggukensis TaxID=2774019 RepID=A0A927Q1X3_9ACTN|nr:hypothetical protein [Nocardioides donggukensis]MBD8869131.1 hypothetical protein [Nocardioides donggukensis]